ncbi:MAG TPA: DUF2232 domain-containing protein [Thermoanaerobaculia bacterium]|nr:DUF2232 domain-containing protein [Thermoanaerobaculia bacterium]
MTDTPIQSEPVMVPDGRSSGRFARSVAAHAALAALMVISPLVVFLPAALMHCGLKNGRRAAWLALTIAVALAGLMAWLSSRAPGASEIEMKMSFAFIAGLVLAVGVPSLLLLPMVERGESMGRVLMLALLLAIGGLAITEGGMRAIAGFSPYQDQLARGRVTASHFVDFYAKNGMQSDAISVFRKWMDIGLSCLPGFFLIDIAVMYVLSLVMLGRLRAWRAFIASRRGVAAEPQRAGPYLFRNFALPEWLLFGFVLGGLSPLLSGLAQTIGANVLAVVAFLYLLQGLAIFRAMLAATGAGALGVAIAYAMLAVLTLTGIAPLLLSIAGLFDSFFDFRHFNRKDDSHEGHTD